MSGEKQARAARAQRAAQARFDRYLDRTAAPDAQEAYEDAQTDMMRDVTRLVRVGAPAALVASTVARHQVLVARAVSDSIAASALLAHRDSIRGVAEYLSMMDDEDVDLDVDEVASRKRHPIVTAINVAGAALATSLATRFVDEFWERHEKKNVDVAVPAAVEASDLEDTVTGAAWMVDRMSDTEVADAYNQGQTEGIKESGDDIYRRWTEHVSDTTWDPTDKKTALDSIYLHAQVALPGEEFSMPDDNPTGEFQGESWDGPPNRPHDRAILTPWRKAWGTPGWLCVGGARVWLVRGIGPRGRKKAR